MIFNIIIQPIQSIQRMFCVYAYISYPIVPASKRYIGAYNSIEQALPDIKKYYNRNLQYERKSSIPNEEMFFIDEHCTGSAKIIRTVWHCSSYSKLPYQYESCQSDNDYSTIITPHVNIFINKYNSGERLMHRYSNDADAEDDE
jgi:hypothetical protein